MCPVCRFNCDELRCCGDQATTATICRSSLLDAHFCRPAALLKPPRGLVKHVWCRPTRDFCCLLITGVFTCSGVLITVTLSFQPYFVTACTCSQHAARICFRMVEVCALRPGRLDYVPHRSPPKDIFRRIFALVRHAPCSTPFGWLLIAVRRCVRRNCFRWLFVALSPINIASGKVPGQS